MSVRRMVLVLALVCAGPVWGDYEAGQRAWDAGHPDEALVQWRDAADAGDGRAMLALGRLYLQGLGVLQDYVHAHKWFNLAASRGEPAAVQERDALAAKMTAEERAEARKLALGWRSSGGQAGVAVEAVRGSPAAIPSPAERSEAPPPHAIREAQQLLARLGYAPGPADGIWNRRTGTAYHTFLRDTGLPTGEVLTPIALRAMRAMAKRAGEDAVASRATTDAGNAAPMPSDASGLRAAPVRPDALHRAAQAGDIDGLKAALDAGVDVNASDSRGWTALMHAANKGYTLLVVPLLGAGADTNLRAADGATALFVAALHGHAEIVAALLRAGADASIQGPKGMTPLEVAQDLNHSRILALPEVVALREAETRRQREEAERKKREEETQRAEEESRAFSRAKSSDTPQAYTHYLSSWCPGGNFCATARTRIDELIRASIEGKTFSGVNSLGDRQVYEFLPSGEVDGVSRPSSWTRNSCSGTWKVEEGKVRARCKWAGGGGWSAVSAELDGDVLTGHERYSREGVASFFGPKLASWTWRLRERSAEDVEAERRKTAQRTSSNSDDRGQ